MAAEPVIRGHPAKNESLETFAVKLANKVIQAANPAATERYIAVAIKALALKKLNGYIILRFIDRVTRYLASHQPFNEQQEESCRLAKQHLRQFRKAVAAPANS